MAVSSEIPLAAEDLTSAWLADAALGRRPLYVEDEEFPADSPNDYDRILQSAGRKPRRMAGMVAIAGTGFLILLLCLVAFNLPRSIASVFA